MQKNDLIFNVKGVIYDPETETGKTSDLIFSLTATFSYLDSTSPHCYGNGTYLSFRGTVGLNSNVRDLYDCRYDTRLKTGRETEYINVLLNDKWCGCNGAYAIKSISIEKAD